MGALSEEEIYFASHCELFATATILTTTLAVFTRPETEKTVDVRKQHYEWHFFYPKPWDQPTVHTERMIFLILEEKHFDVVTSV